MIREGRKFCSVDVVIEKDLCSVKLAEEVGVDIFFIATDVDGAAIHYGKSNQRIFRSVTLKEAARYFEESHFSPGSMGPKIEAAMQFVQDSGKRAVITTVENIEKAVVEKIGTENI